MTATRSPLPVPVLCLAFLAVTGPAPASLTLVVRDPATWVAGTPVDVAIAQTAALGAWLCLAWLVGGALLVLATRAPGATGRIADATARRVLPCVLRRALQTTLGLSLAAGGLAGTALPARAQEATSTASTSTTSPNPASSSTASDVGPFDRPASPPVHADRPGGAPMASTVTPPADAIRLLGGATRSGVVVAPGDSLWRIAAVALGAGASDADIDRTWRRWYAANTAVIGADPHLIRPGQRLAPPA